jgi:hypothetical protein
MIDTPDFVECNKVGSTSIYFEGTECGCQENLREKPMNNFEFMRTENECCSGIDPEQGIAYLAVRLQ